MPRPLTRLAILAPFALALPLGAAARQAWQDARLHGWWEGGLHALTGRAFRAALPDQLGLAVGAGALVLVLALAASAVPRLAGPVDSRPLRALSGLLVVALAMLSGATALSSRTLHAPPERPNVLLLVVDTLRADHVDLGDGARAETPHLRALAARGTAWSQARSQGACTINGAPSILLSRYPSEALYTNYTKSVSQGFVSLPELFSNHGYATWARSSNPHVSSWNGLSQGFATFEQDLDWADADAPKINGELLAWLDGRRDDPRPFLAMAWYVDPHTPLFPPGEELERLFTPEEREAVGKGVAEVGPDDADWPEEKRALVRKLYRAEVEGWDRALGALLDALADRGLLDDTIVVVTSDHGESLWDRTDANGRVLVGHGNSLHVEQLHIPLLYAGPGIASGARGGLAGNIDVAPTLAHLVGLPDTAVRAAGFQGRVLDPEGPPAAAIVSEIHKEQTGKSLQRAIETPKAKLVRIRSIQSGPLDPPVEWLLDPAAAEAPLPADPALQAELAAGLQRWESTLKPREPGLISLGREAQAQVEDQLRALGYLDD